MKYLLFSDLHGTEEGFAQLTKHPEFIADQKICLGDVVEFNQSCIEYFEKVQQVSDQIVLGNHEAVLTGGCDVEVFNERVHHAIASTTTWLTSNHPEFLATLSKLPKQLAIGEAQATHASFNPAKLWQHVRYTEDVQAQEQHLPARINFLAHGHIPFIAWKEGDLWYYQRQVYGKSFRLEPTTTYVINTGSVLGSREMRQYERTFVAYDQSAQTINFYNVSQQ